MIGVIVLIVIVLIIVLIMGKSKSNKMENKPENLVGNWVSAVIGKGMQGSGKITVGRTTADINVSGDISLKIDKVENNVASGTVTYNNLCYTSIRSTTSKTTPAQAPKCVSGISKTIQAQITGDKLTIQGQTILGVNLAYEATYTNNDITGTFSRTGSNDKINENFSGTFNLFRAKK